MHELHTAFLNLKGTQACCGPVRLVPCSLCVQKLDYLEYLAKFDHLFDIPKANKNNAYKKFDYLTS